MINNTRGEITVLVREIGTDEIVAEHTVKNVFTDVGLEYLFWNQNQSLNNTNILISNGTKIPLNLINASQTFPFNTYVTSYVPSGFQRITWGEPAGGQPWFGQVYGRFDPPSSTRTITNISLILGVPDQTAPALGSYTGGAMAAYATLSTPCTQTTTQYLDIYYKVFFPQTTNATLSVTGYRELVRDMAGISGYTARGNGPIGQYCIQPWNSNIQPGTVNSNGVAVDTNITIGGNGNLVGYTGNSNLPAGSPYTMINTLLGAPSSTYMYNHAGVKQTWTYNQTQAVGAQFGYIRGGIALTYYGLMLPSVTYPIRKGSNIQNVFRHSSTSTLPFLDVNGLATSLGNAVPSGNWDSANNLSDMYFIDIVTGGPVGTATYRYRRRKVVQLAGNNYAYIGATINNLCCDTVSFTVSPTDTVTPVQTSLTTISDYNHRISCSKSLNNHTVVMVYTNFIIVHDIITNISTVYSATNFPSFTPTDITQIETDSLNNIWVACRNTGLYRINGTTINAYGTAQGLPSNTCFGVCSGQMSGGNEKIWAIFDGAIASATAADNFVTWTQYNPTSTPSFSYAGVSDNNWSTVEYIKVDPQTDQMLMVRSPTTTVNPTLVGVWWSSLTAATPLTIATNKVSPSMADFRVHRQLLDVSKNSSFWAVVVNDANNNASYQKLTFGTATSSVLTTTSTVEAALIGIYFEYDYVAGVDVLVVTGSVPNSSYNMLVNTAQPRSVFGIAPSGTITTITNNSSPDITGNSSDSYNRRVSYTAGVSSNVSPTTSVRDIFGKIWLERGLYVMVAKQSVYSDTVPANVAVNVQVWASPYATSAADGGLLKSINDYMYGWNGTSWVLGSTGTATTSTVPQLLDHGVSIAFTDGTPSTQSFVAGDYFTFFACEGIMKDNASSLSFTTVQYLKSPIYGQTNMPATISGPYASVTVPTVQTSYTQVAPGVTVNGSNQVVLTGEPGDYAVMDLPLTGNFDLTIDLSTVSLPKGTKIGLGFGTQIYYGVGYDTAGIQYSWWRSPDSGTFVSQYKSVQYYNGTPSQTQPGTVQNIRFTRTGTTSKTISIYVNGTLVKSDATAAFTTGTTYQLIFRSWQSVGPVTIGAATVTSADASPPMVKLGNVANKTGAYDPFFYGLDVVQPSTYSTITIDGVPVTNVYGSTTGTINTPNSGEIVVDQSGWIQFNPADVAKSLGGTYLYLQDTGIV